MPFTAEQIAESAAYLADPYNLPRDIDVEIGAWLDEQDDVHVEVDGRCTCGAQWVWFDDEQVSDCDAVGPRV